MGNRLKWDFYSYYGDDITEVGLFLAKRIEANTHTFGAEMKVETGREERQVLKVKVPRAVSKNFREAFLKHKLRWKDVFQEVGN